MLQNILQGQIFDPEIVKHSSEKPVQNLIAKCTPNAVDTTFPDWIWSTFDDITYQEGEPLAFESSVPGCGNINKGLIVCYVLFVIKFICLYLVVY